MIESYTDKATTWAHAQEDSDNVNKPNTISPNYNVNDQINTNRITGSTGTSNNSNYSINNDTNTFEGMFYYIFNKSNILLFLWFLAIYFIAYYILSFFFNRGEDVTNYQLRLSRTIDIITMLCLLVILISIYSSYSQTQQEKSLQNLSTSTINFINDPLSIIYMLFFFIFFYLIVNLFRLPMDRDTKPIMISLIETIAWILFVVIIFTNFFKYVLSISITGIISDIFDWSHLPQYSPYPSYYVGNTIVGGNTISTSTTTPTITSSSHINEPTTAPTLNLSQPVQKDEVFNISNNLYTYDDAQAICSSYGAKIATYDQIEDAYNHGAEWCNYGWSDGQMAYFPTQKSTWQELQKTDKNKNDCGRPGINGGHFANPYIKFGVNCFGKKPAPNEGELNRMKAQNNKIYPKSQKDSELEKKVQFWKENADKLLLINSYNKKEWSEY